MKKTRSGKLSLLLAGAALVCSLTGCMTKAVDNTAQDVGYFASNKVTFSHMSAGSMAVIQETPIQIPDKHEAVYTCTMTYAEGETTVLKLGDTELLMMSEDLFRVGGSATQADFVPGTYGVKVTVNPSQLMLMVEITLPDGGTMRRGGSSFLGGELFSWSSTGANAVTDVDVQYLPVSPIEYEISTDTVRKTSFQTKVYNLISSFDDACTTRLFSWTTKNSFVKDTDGMVIQYRVKGTSEWTQVDARQMAEATENTRESYFKADLLGLVADTEYEYQLGLKGSTNADHWSEILTFKTAPKSVKTFQFVAVGDTQATNWSGTDLENKGYTYCRTALDMAFRDAEDAAFILHAGDVTDWGSNMNMWNWYFQSIAKYAGSVPHFATMGNHDTWSDDLNNYFSLHFNHPDNGATALDKTYTDQINDENLRVLVDNPEDMIYSYDYGSVHFIVLNSGSYVGDDEYFLQAQRQWLINDLEANKEAKWKVVLVHEPVYHRKGGQESRPWLYDVIEGYGVDLVLQGHSHLVTRTYPMKNGEIVTKSSPDLIQQGTGTVYTTIGSTTLNHDSMGDNTVEECLLMTTPDNHQAAYTVVSVEKDRLVMTVKQLDGLVLDQFTILGAVEPEDAVTTAELSSESHETVSETSESQPQSTPEQGGCGSVITVGAVAAGLTLSLAACVLSKKKEEDTEPNHLG